MVPAESKILIIDDEPFLRSTMGLILQRVGYDYSEASCAAEALSAAKHDRFNLIFLDLHLPDMDGLEILLELRRLQPSTPVVILTANGSLEKAIEALRRGAHEYLLKPFNPGQILTLVDDILEQQKTGLRECGETESVPKRRDEKPGPAASEDFFLDFENHTLTYKGRLISLPPCTFEYLVTLLNHSPHVVTYQELVRESQGYLLSPVEAQDLAQWRIYRLRKAIEENPNDPRLIVTVPGVGYKLLLH